MARFQLLLSWCQQRVALAEALDGQIATWQQRRGAVARALAGRLCRWVNGVGVLVGRGVKDRVCCPAAAGPAGAARGAAPPRARQRRVIDGAG